jgi:hypothetical protein
MGVLLTRQILGDCIEFPVLQGLSLPINVNGSPDEEYIHKLVINKMHCIKTVTRMTGGMKNDIWSPFITQLMIQGEVIQKRGTLIFSSFTQSANSQLLQTHPRAR